MTIKEFKKIVNKFGNMPSGDDLFLIVDEDNAQDFERWLSAYTDTRDGLWLAYSVSKAYNSENWIVRLSC
jgi:hypothetical protein